MGEEKRIVVGEGVEEKVQRIDREDREELMAWRNRKLYGITKVVIE